MHFPTLMTECAPPEDVAAITSALIARKAETRELGAAPLPRPIEAFVDGEFEAARNVFPAAPCAPSPEAKDAADRLFRSTLLRSAEHPASTFRAALAT